MMKTSNIILLGFLIIVFATPVFLFMGFRNKIMQGKFTVTKTHESHESENFGIPFKFSGSIKPFKILKIVGPGMDDVFSCNIIPASSATYDYINPTKQDSINFQQKGDTLLVKYLGSTIIVNGNSISNVYNQLVVNLHLPIIKNIIVEGANISLDSVNTVSNPEIYVELNKKATLTLGRNGTTTRMSINYSDKVGTNIHQLTNTSSTVIEKSSGQFNKLIIKATDSNVNFGSLTWIKDLNLQMLGVSKISVDDQSRINQLKGFISDSAKVEANWKNIRMLASLTGK